MLVFQLNDNEVYIDLCLWCREWA